MSASRLAASTFSPAHDCKFQQALDALSHGAYFVDRQRRVQYWNKACERITGFSAEEVTGRSCADNVLCHVDEKGTELCKDDRCPLMACMTSGEARMADVYFHHKLGHRVAIWVSGSPVRDHSGKIVGAIELFQCNGPQRAAQRRLKRLKKLASVDVLTQIPNRRYIETALSTAARKSSATGSPFGVLMIDLDHFKCVNDKYGHAVGDAVLLFVAKTLEHSLRGSDLIGRWGGEEFVAVLPGIKTAALKKLAERCRALVETSWVTAGRDRVGVTVSLGGTMFEQSDTVSSLIRRADRLLYRSKAKGRNRVTVS